MVATVPHVNFQSSKPKGLRAQTALSVPIEGKCFFGAVTNWKPVRSDAEAACDSKNGGCQQRARARPSRGTRGRPLGEGTPHRLRVLCADEIDKFAAGFDELNAAIRAYSEKLERWQKTTIEHIRSMSAADFP